MSGCVIRCEQRKKNGGAEKKICGPKMFLGAEIVFGGVGKVNYPPNTITRRRRKNPKEPRFFRLGTEKYDFRASKEQRPRRSKRLSLS